MLYTGIIDADGVPAIWIQRDQLDRHGITVAAVNPQMVRVRSRRNGTVCEMPAATYVSVATNAAKIDADTPPAQPPNDWGNFRYFGTDIRARRQAGGASIEISMLGARNALLLSNLELLMLKDQPLEVVIGAYEAADIHLGLQPNEPAHR